MLINGGVEWWPVASGALAALVAGLVLFIFKRHWGYQDKLEETAQTALKTSIDSLDKRLDHETKERREEDDKLREKDDEQGYDIQDNRGALDFLCAQLGKDRPVYRSKRK